MEVFINTKEAARRLNMSVGNVQALCRSKWKGFPVIRIGNKYLINASLLDQWAQTITKEGADIH